MNELMPNQVEAITKLTKYRVGALFMEAGTGKTRCTIELVNSIEDIDFVLYIAPLRTIITEGVSPSVIDEVEKWGGFHARAEYIGIESIGGSDRIYMNLLNKLQDYKNIFVICDESIKIKNFNAKRTRRVIEIGKLAQYRLVLNGTPITRNIMDLWSQMEFLSPKILSMNETQFKNTFCKYTTIRRTVANRTFTKEFITGYENIDYLNDLIKYYVYNADLTLTVDQCFHSLSYSITDEEREEYESIKERFLSKEELEWRNNNIFIAMTQKMQHCYSCSPGKIEACKKIFETKDQSKAIIFCKYISSQDLCKLYFKDALVLSYQTSALGLNLQEYTTTIFFDKIWDYYLRSQSGNRTYRVGQDENCHYFDLDGDVKLETLISRNVEKKIGMVEYFKNKSKEEIAKIL